MAASSSVKRIGILGHVGFENLGDEATVAAVIQNIRLRYPNAEIYGFTSKPADTQKRHKIQSFPIRMESAHVAPVEQEREKTINAQKENNENRYEKIRKRLRRFPVIYAFLRTLYQSAHLFLTFFKELLFLVRSHRHLKRIDLLLIVGSNQLFDYVGGAWAFPYTLFKWSLMAKVSGIKLGFLSVGAGPIDSALSRYFIKSSLSFAEYRSYRDKSSKELIEKIGVSKENHVFPDLAYSLQIDKQAVMPSVHLPESRSVVGINPLPFFDPRYWAESSKEAYESYIEVQASFASWLIQNGYAVRLLPTQLRADPPVIKDIKEIMIRDGVLKVDDGSIDPPVHTFDDLVAQISKTDLMVAARFHGIIISFLMGKPVVGISYYKKTYDLMGSMGQSEYVLDIRSLTLQSLIDRFVFLESNSKVVKDIIESRVSECRQALQIQYGLVLS